MRRLRALVYRVWSLFGRTRRERELAEELESHIVFATEERVRRGMPPAEARRQAILDFGGLERTREEYRDQGAVPLIETTLRDLRYAAHALSRSPGFTIVTVLILGLGIGGTTAIFSLADAALLRPLPVRAPSQLVLVTTRGRTTAPPYPALERFTAQRQSFTGFAAFSPSDHLPLIIDGHAESSLNHGAKVGNRQGLQRGG